MPTFTLRVPKVVDSRQRRNPARPATVQRFIQRLHRALIESRVKLTHAATEEALDHFGLSPAGVFTVLRRLTSDDYDHEEPAVNDPRETMWFFHVVVPGPTHYGQTARVIIRETPSFYIIKFHRDIYDDEGN